MESLYLIDVMALAYRSFFAFINNPLKKGSQETSALFGFASHSLRLIAECKPTYLAYVRDLPKPTFRHELYKEYKAHRKPMPDSLISQLPLIDDFVAKSGLKTVALEGYEADDLMAALACTARERNIKTYIVTRDKDMMQLVDDRVFLFELGKAKQESLIVGAEQVKEKMGVPPERIVDYLSLIGDASDNVPGVAKVGPKTAVELLETYGTLERIYENVENISKKGLRENLKAGRENAFLSKKLVTLDCDVKSPVALEDLRYQGVNAEATTAYLMEWELKSLVRLVPGGATAAKGMAAGQAALDLPNLGTAPGAAPAAAIAQEVAEAAADYPQERPEPEARYELIDTPEALAALAKRLEAAGRIAVDTETTDLDNKVAKLVGLCLSIEAHAGYYLPVDHLEGRNLPLALVKEVLAPILAEPSKLLLFHNAKYDMPILRRHGLLAADFAWPGTPERRLADTLVAAHLANPGERNLSLDDLALRLFGHEMIPIEALIGKAARGQKQKNFSETAIADACKYGAEDADITFRLWEYYEKELREKGQIDLYFDEEMALTPVLEAMEGKGISLDVEALNVLSGKLDTEIHRLEKEIHAAAGEEFNIGSPQQLQVILFEKLGLKSGKKTKTGFSTDADVLGRLEGEHPIVSMLLDHRECTKLQSTYVEALPHLVHPKTHRVHTHYSQVIAATGRLSSINPNLQNIPIRTELGQAVRKCFTASAPGRLLLCADYSQIELRLLAHLSGDPALRDAYQRGLDIHARTAASLYGVPEDKVTADMRRSAKVVNFGVLYGMGAHRLANQLRIPRAEAARFIDNYFSTFSMVNSYITDTVNKGRQLGYVETLSGRRRYLPDLHSENRMLRENAERIAANTPIQGSAADLIKLAMIRVHKNLADSGLDCDMLLQVHDELVFEVAEKDLDAAAALIKRDMEGAMRLEVPLLVSFGKAFNWLEAHS